VAYVTLTLAEKSQNALNYFSGFRFQYMPTTWPRTFYLAGWGFVANLITYFSTMICSYTPDIKLCISQKL